jgi:ABC-type sugar transport system permease subunit
MANSVVPARRAQATTRGWRARESLIGYLLVLPIILLFLGLIAYPFFNAIWLSVTDRIIGSGGNFVGLRNYLWLLNWPDFALMFANTWTIAIVGVAIKFCVGLGLALVMNERFFGRGLLRGVLLLPWALPTFVAVLTWRWLFEGQSGVFNVILQSLGITSGPVPWLGSTTFALPAVITVVVWKGFPFFAIGYLAGLQAIPQELYEAAHVDGANAIQRFRHITLPGLRHVIMITCLLSLIWTSNSFEFVYLLTGGGPSNRTQVFTVMTYQLGIQNMRIGEAAAVPLMFLPILAGLIVLVTRYILREEEG